MSTRASVQPQLNLFRDRRALPQIVKPVGDDHECLADAPRLRSPDQKTLRIRRHIHDHVSKEDPLSLNSGQA